VDRRRGYRQMEMEDGERLAATDGLAVTTGAQEFLRLVRTRRSIRRYKPTPPRKDMIKAVLEAGRWAPSAVNSQPWHFLVVTDPDRRRQLADRARMLGFIRWRHLYHAPVVLAIIGAVRGNRFAVVDCALAGMNMLLAAHALGLGACWIGGFTQEQVRGVLGVPADREVIGLITLGYPDETPRNPPRLPLARLVSWEVYDPAALATHGERFRLSGLYSLRKRIASMLRPGRR